MIFDRDNVRFTMLGA